MAHVAKHTRTAAGHLCLHYERAKDENGQYLKFGNQDIDPTKTAENYNLAPDHGGGQMEFIRKRCAEVKCLNRKDVNVMCSWIVTAPQPVAGTDIEKDFFKKTYEFLGNRYGKENIVSAHVHRDENTPHMHFAFVPIVQYENKKTKEIGYKVSAKEVVNRADLQTFHADLERSLAQHFGYELGVQNGATRDGNKSIEELKRGTAAAQLAEITQKAATAAQNERKALDKLEHVIAEKNALQAQIEAYRGTLQTFHDIDVIGKRSALGGKVSMTVEEADKLKEQAKAFYAQRSKASEAVGAADRLRARYAGLEKREAELGDLRMEVHNLKMEKRDALRKIENIKEVILSSPELTKTYNERVQAMREQEREQNRGQSMGYER